MFNHDFFLACELFGSEGCYISVSTAKYFFHCKKCDNDWFIISEEIREASPLVLQGFRLLFGGITSPVIRRVMLRLAPEADRSRNFMLREIFPTLPSLLVEVDFLFPALRPGRRFAFGIQGRVQKSAGGGHWRV